MNEDELKVMVARAGVYWHLGEGVRCFTIHDVLRLIAEIRRLWAEREWVSVSDGCHPECGSTFLGIDEDGMFYIASRSAGGFVYDEKLCPLDITHWMPLPPAPTPNPEAK